MRQVRQVRFPSGYNELWGRKVTVLRAQDGYKMTFWPESGILVIDDAKDGGEVVVHASRCDIYLEPEDAPKPAAAPPPKDGGVIIMAEPKGGKGSPQVR